MMSSYLFNTRSLGVALAVQPVEAEVGFFEIEEMFEIISRAERVGAAIEIAELAIAEGSAAVHGVVGRVVRVNAGAP